MNFKPIELQVALPRTVDAGSRMQELTQRPIQEQNLLAKETDQQIQKNLQSTQEADPEHQIGDSDHHSSQERRESRQQNDDEKSSDIEAAHPYKGKHIDISL